MKKTRRLLQETTGLPYRRGTTLVEADFPRAGAGSGPLPLRPGRTACVHGVRSRRPDIGGRPQTSYRLRRPVFRSGEGRAEAVRPAFGRGAPRRVRLPFGCVAPTRSSLSPGRKAYCSCSSRMDDIRLTKKPAVSSRDDGPSWPAAVPLLLPPTTSRTGCRDSGFRIRRPSAASRARSRGPAVPVYWMRLKRRASFHRSAPRRVRVSHPLRRTNPQLSEAGRQPYCSCSRRLLRLF